MIKLLLFLSWGLYLPHGGGGRRNYQQRGHNVRDKSKGNISDNQTRRNQRLCPCSISIPASWTFVKKNALQAPSRSGPYPNGPGCLEPWTDKRVEKGPLPVASFPGVSTSPVDSPAPPQPPETAASGSYQGGGERLKRLAFFFSTNGPFF